MLSHIKQQTPQQQQRQPNKRNLKSDEWIMWSNKLREILEKRVDVLCGKNKQNEGSKEHRERVIEKEINVACGNCLYEAFASSAKC